MLARAKLGGADLRSCKVTGANFSEADLSRGDLRDLDLTGCFFSRTDLTDANLSRTDLMNAMLARAVVRGARFEEANLFRADAAGPTQVTQLFIDLLDQLGNDFTDFLDSWDDSSNAVKGYLEIKSNSNPDVTVSLWRISSVTAVAGYRKVGLTFVSGTLPANGEACVISFSRAGDQGATG